MSISDENLVKECLVGKPYYQRLLYERYSGKMLAICCRYLKDRMEAEDAMIQCFIKVFNHLDSFKGGSLENWLRSIFIRYSISRWRVFKNQILFQSDDLSKYENNWEYSETTEVGYEELQLAIDSLPDGCQVIFKLIVIEGYSHKEAAEMLGINEGTSRSQLNRARNLLQNKLTIKLEK